MKKFLIPFSVFVLMISAGITASAQNKSEIKEAKKEAKDFAKDGWKVTPGDLSLVEQMINSKAVLRNSEEWITAKSITAGEVYDVVRSNALMQAKMEVGKLVETDLAGEGKLKIANEKKGGSKAKSAISFREGARSRFAAAIKRPKILVDCYRKLDNGEIEVQIRIAVPAEQAEILYLEAFEEQLQNE